MRSQGTSSVRRCQPHSEEGEGSPGLRGEEAGLLGQSPLCLLPQLRPLQNGTPSDPLLLSPGGYWVCWLVGSNKLTFGGLYWVFIAAPGLYLVEACGGYSLGVAHRLVPEVLLLSWGLWASVVAPRLALWLSHSTTCGIFLDRKSNLRPLHWRADAYPPCHQ